MVRQQKGSRTEQTRKGKHPKRPSTGSSPSRTYGTEESESERSSVGGPPRGFDYTMDGRSRPRNALDGGVHTPVEDTGAGIHELTGLDPIGEISLTEAEFQTPQDLLDRGDYEESARRSVRPNTLGEEYAAGDPDIGLFGTQDLRYGGEDLSSASEWSMRARAPELDDGLDAGDFKRSDREIFAALLEAAQSLLANDERVEIMVEGGEVTFTGNVNSQDHREALENVALTTPGVREVRNNVELVNGDR